MYVIKIYYSVPTLINLSNAFENSSTESSGLIIRNSSFEPVLKLTGQNRIDETIVIICYHCYETLLIDETILNSSICRDGTLSICS